MAATARMLVTHLHGPIDVCVAWEQWGGVKSNGTYYGAHTRQGIEHCVAVTVAEFLLRLDVLFSSLYLLLLRVGASPSHVRKVRS